jgi:hypothetical protein
MTVLRGFTVALLGALLIATAAAGRSAGTLELRARIGVTSDGGACPAGTPANVDCYARSGQTRISGLGTVSESYTWLFAVGSPDCPANLAKPLAATGRLVVAGKGEFTFSLAPGAQCVDVEPVRNEPQAFTITGGTGTFVGASGQGRVERSLGGGAGTETWIGTIEVPGYTFDLTAPELSGATSKTVRAPRGSKSAKVTYKVSAIDDVDGAVPTVCQPKSGSRFKVGKTTVRCTATDTSGNTGKASFVVTVKRR